MASNSKKRDVNDAGEFGTDAAYMGDQPGSGQILSDLVEDITTTSFDDPSELERNETIGEVVLEMQRTNERLDIENQRLRQALMSQQNQTEDGYRRMAFELVRSLSTNPAGDPRNQPTAALDKRLKVLIPSYPVTWV